MRKRGNSLEIKSKLFPEPANTTSALFAMSSFTIGMHLVAWPSPQLRGAINMVFLCPIWIYFCTAEFIPHGQR